MKAKTSDSQIHGMKILPKEGLVLIFWFASPKRSFCEDALTSAGSLHYGAKLDSLLETPNLQARLYPGINSICPSEQACDMMGGWNA
jgi:hypothetical protein